MHLYRSAALALFAAFHLAAAPLSGQGGGEAGAGTGMRRAGLHAGVVVHSQLGSVTGTLSRVDAADLSLDVAVHAESSTLKGGAVAWRPAPDLAVRLRVGQTRSHMALEALARPASGPGVQTFEFDGLGEVELWLASAEVVWTLPVSDGGVRPYAIVGVGASRWQLRGLEDLDFPPLLESPVSLDPVSTTLPSITAGGGIAVALGGAWSLALEVSDFVSGNPLDDDDFRIGASFSGVGRARDLVHSLSVSAGVRVAF